MGSGKASRSVLRRAGIISTGAGNGSLQMSYTANQGLRGAICAAFCGAVLVVAGCSGGPRSAARVTAPASPAIVEGVALLGQGHPLLGRVWSVRERRYVDPARVEAEVRASRFVLLGERHGNPDHHALQGRLIAAAGRDGRRAAVVAEQLDFDQQPAIDACRSGCADVGAELGARVNWDRSGWPPYAVYRPVFDAAGAVRAPVYAGNAGAKRIRALSRGEAPSAEEAPWVGKARAPLSTRGRERLVADLTEGHCGHLPSEYAESLVLAQRLRDASMGATLLRAAVAADRPDTVVLVAGTGHARRDYGVPTLLDAEALVVGFVEVSDGEGRPEKYGPVEGFDYLWFTRRVDEPDPCEKLRERLEKMKPGGRAS